MKVLILLSALIACASAGIIRSSGWNGGHSGWGSSPWVSSSSSSGWSSNPWGSSSGWSSNPWGSSGGWSSGWSSQPKIVKIIKVGNNGWNNGGGWSHGGGWSGNSLGSGWSSGNDGWSNGWSSSGW